MKRRKIVDFIAYEPYVPGLICPSSCFGDFLKTDISNPETWASSRGRNLFGQEYGPEYQPIMMRNKQDLSKSLWSMLRGLFN